MTAAPIQCFNCFGSGTCIFYPTVESVVEVDASGWLLSPLLNWFEAECPYCQGEGEFPDDDSDSEGLDPFPGMGFNWV